MPRLLSVFSRRKNSILRRIVMTLSRLVVLVQVRVPRFVAVASGIRVNLGKYQGHYQVSEHEHGLKPSSKSTAIQRLPSCKSKYNRYRQQNEKSNPELLTRSRNGAAGQLDFGGLPKPCVDPRQPHSHFPEHVVWKHHCRHKASIAVPNSFESNRCRLLVSD